MEENQQTAPQMQPAPAPQSPVTASNQNLMGALAYLLGFVSGIAFLVIEKKNKFVRFHAMQSVMVSAGIFVLSIILGVIPVIGWILGMLLGPVSLILWIVMMYKAYSGEMYKLPYVGEMAEKQIAKMG